MNYFKSAILFFLAYNITCFAGHPWTLQDMLHVNTIKNVEISPDGKNVLYVGSKANLGKNQFISRIYKSSTKHGSADNPLTDDDCSSMQPQWSPDGTKIAFISDKSGKRNLYLMDADGQNVRPLTQAAENVQTYRWSPDGQSLAFVMAEKLPAIRNEAGIAIIVDEETSINRLWLISADGGQPWPLTTDEFYVRGAGGWGTTNPEFDWSPNSKKIVFAYTVKSGFDSFFLDSSIAIIDLETETITPFEKQAQHESMPAYSPDGKSIAFLESGQESNYIFYRRIGVCNADGSNRTSLAPTFDEGPFLMGQNLLGWTSDSQNVLYIEPKKTQFRLYFLPKDQSSRIEWTISEEMMYNNLSVCKDGNQIAFVGQSPDRPPEVYLASLDEGEISQISHLNHHVLQHNKVKTEVIRWASVDGKLIEGLLSYPANYQEGKTYPLLLEIHGGPMSFYTESFVGTSWIYPIPMFAQEGFFVLRPNPRGSCGYGKEFRSANLGDLGGKDFQDLMSGIDFVIKRGQADPERLGVMGWSYGGYMTAWTVTQTQRFKAASIGAGMCNFLSMDGTMDLHRFISGLLLAPYWEKPELYYDRSPIHYVANVSTPCLIQHGDADIRVPLTQSYEFYHALKKLGQSPLFVIYPNMEHSPSKPKQNLSLMEFNLNWFKEHITSK